MEVVRTARYWVWGPADAAHTWVVLHGYRQLAGRFIRRFRELTEQGARVVAPEALSRFYLDDDGGPHGPDAKVGATWMTREDRDVEIADYLRYLDALARTLDLEGQTGALTLLGFSQGAHTAARWFTLGETRFDRLVLWGAGLPHDLDLSAHAERWRDARVLLVHGHADRAHSEGSRTRDLERLAAVGVSPHTLAHGGGHAIDGELLRTLR
ncbi:MAG: hypothetical protein R3E10_01315 [Gemmatimonadota bacterium]